MSSGVLGPGRRAAAVSVTFDHLGEASELQRGDLPLDTEIGDHSVALHSIVEAGHTLGWHAWWNEPIYRTTWHTANVERTVAAAGFTSFIFHLPWTDTPERVQVIGEPIDQLTADERIWFAPSQEIADWIRKHPQDFPQVEHADEPPAW